LEAFCRDAPAGFALPEKEPEKSDDASLRSFTTLVHALKSALANIGADGLSQAAALLEKAGREADLPVIRDRLPSFREELAALTARIEEITAAARSGDGEKRAGPELREALARLRESLEARDFEAMDAALARLQALPLTGEAREAAGEIADCVLTADFGKAMDAVTLLAAREEQK
jgi:HPt (histidine-containing phosphotransfer) domain-containing protein